MKTSLVILATVALLGAAACGSSPKKHTEAPKSSSKEPKQQEPVMYGHVAAMTQTGKRYELRFDPALWLTGVSAERAAKEDTGSSDVPNDYYIVEEGHRLITFLVAPTAHVTALTNHGEGPLGETPITVAELAQIVQGKNPKHRQLMEPKAGFWIHVSGDTVLSLDQQYQP
jgi:hypothetical protein